MIAQSCISIALRGNHDIGKHTTLKMKSVRPHEKKNRLPLKEEVKRVLFCKRKDRKCMSMSFFKELFRERKQSMHKQDKFL